MDSTSPVCFVTPDYQLALNPNDTRYEDFCLEYIFDLENRQMCYVGKPEPELVRELRHDAVARNYFDSIVGTPEKLMEFARKDGLSKAAMTALLDPGIRQAFLTLCTIFEKGATGECGANRDPCLESGCAFEGTDETCLNAILLSQGKCLRECVDVWAYKFQDPANRIEIWRK